MNRISFDLVSLPEVIVVGDVMLDVRAEAPDLLLGGDVRGRVRVRPAGGAANAAVWAVEAGATATVVGRVGSDPAGRVLEEGLGDRGVRLELFRDQEAPTGTMLVVVAGDHRSMVSDRGANARLSTEDLPAMRAAAVLVSAYPLFDPASRDAAAAALERAQAEVVAVDAASWPLIEEIGAGRFLELVEPATLLLANEREAEALTGLSGEMAASALAGDGRAACVKLDGGGAAYADRAGLRRVETRAKEVVDPTGAGDAFAGTLLGRLATGTALAEALEAAARAAADVVAGEEAWPS